MTLASWAWAWLSAEPMANKDRPVSHDLARPAAAPFTRVQEDQARKARVENTVGYKAREALIERAERFISDGATEAERLDQRLAESQVMTSARSLAVE